MTNNIIVMQYQTSVHLVVYNGAPWLKWCLESLAKQTYQDFFLLIIDNGSIDSSGELANDFLLGHSSLAKRTRLIKNKHNIGFAKGHNQAMAWTDSEYVLIVNQDAYLLPEYLAYLVSSLMQNDRAGAVSGKILHWPFNEETFHVTEFSKLAKNYFDSMGLAILRSRRVINLAQGEEDTGQYESPRQVFGVPGTVPLYRRAALENVSVQGEIFDEDFVSYKEDVDIAWRLNLAGYEAWLEPRAVCYHDRSLSHGLGLRQEYMKRKGRPRDLKVYSWVNHIGVLVKNDGVINFWRDFPWWFGHELAKAFFLLLTDPLTIFYGLWRLFKLLPRFYKKRRALKATRKISYRELRRWWTKAKVTSSGI